MKVNAPQPERSGSAKLLAAGVAPGRHRELVLSGSAEMLRLKREAGGQGETSNGGARRYFGLEARGDRAAGNGPVPGELIAEVG